MLRKLLLFVLLLSTVAVPAQEPFAPSIPFVVKFTGSLHGLQGQPSPAPIGVTFALYKEESGGAPLWIETQNVTVDSQGRFTVLLGAASGKGLPPDVFASGEARWLGITPDDGVERARVILASVPYAFKAADAQTIGGRAPEEFVTREQLGSYLLLPIRFPDPGSPSWIATRPLSGSGGGPADGSLSTTPSGNQVITQAPGTSMNVNNFNDTRTVQASDNWSVSNIATALTAGVQTTLTLTPCPLGVDTSGSPTLGGPNGGYSVHIIDGALPNTNSESVYVTGGTCTSAATSGTIIFTPYFSHVMLTSTIGSASSGIQEAINDACGTNTTGYKDSGCHVIIPPTGPQLSSYLGSEVYDTIYFHASGSVLSGYGSILNCHERGPCLQVGNLSNANDYNSNTIEGISFRSLDNRRSDPAFSGSLIQATQRIGGTITIQTAAPHNLRTGDRVTQMLTDTSNYWGDVPSIMVTDAMHYTYTRASTADIPLQATPGIVALSYEAVLDNANSTRLVDLQYEKTYEYGGFNHFFDFWDDENAQIEKFTNNGIGLIQSANWTGSFVWSGGALTLPNIAQQLASVITVKNSSFTANGSNCATVYNSNGFYVENSVCQAQGPWEFLVSTINGNYQGADFQNIYSEASLSVNPASPAKSPWPGLGVAGFIGGPTSGAGGYTLRGQGGFGGLLPIVGSGSATYVYYVVARDVTAKTQTSPLPFMYEKEVSPGQVPVRWPRLAAGTDTIVYDLIRNYAPGGTMNAAAGGYVAPYAGGCNGGSPSACGSVAIGLAQCAGFVCSFADTTANATSAYSIRNGNFAPNPTFWPGTAVLTSTALISDREVPVTGIAFNGAPSEYANYCSAYGANVSGGYTVCSGSPTTANNSVPNQPPLMLTDGASSGGGGLPGAKGRLIFESTATGKSNSHQIITLYDSNPAKTQATTGHRPVGDPGDMYMGIDPNGYLMIGGGVKGVAQYVNNIGDGVNMGELLTSSLKAFKVPLQAPTVNTITGLQINGSFGAPGQCLISTGIGSKWDTCPTTPTPRWWWWDTYPGTLREYTRVSLGDLGSQRALTTEVDLSRSRFDKFEPPVNGAPTGKAYQVVGDVTSSPFVPAPANTTLRADSDGKAKACENGGVCTGLSKAGHVGWTWAGRTSGSVSFFSALVNGTCADRTFPWNGVGTSETLIAGWPADLNSGLIGSLYVSSADTVTVRLCNFSGAAVTPGILTFTATLALESLSGTGSLSFAALPNGTCGAQTFFQMGVSGGDPVAPKWPSTLEAGLLGAMRASADNTIEVRLCNFSGAALTPASQTFGASIAK